MGRAKEAMLEHEYMTSQAALFLVSIGELEQCEAHQTIYGGGFWDLDDAFWQKVVGMRKNSHPGLVWAEGLSHPEFTDVIKDAYEEHAADVCWSCDKVMQE